MRTEGLRRALIPVSLILAIVFFIAFISTPVRATAVISHPGGTTVEINPGENFTLRHRLLWDDPANPGYYLVAIYWDYLDNARHFTLQSAVAYFDSDGDNVPDAGVAMIDNTVMTMDNGTRYSLTVSPAAGDSRDGEFNVDIKLRASGPDGTPHVGTDNHPIKYTIIQSQEAIPPATVVPAPVTVRVLGPDVDVKISPSEKSGPLGATLSYSVTVTNTGAFSDTYDLTIIDNESWGPTLDNYLFENVQPRENRTTALSVTIPESAVPCTKDNIKVTATSQGYPDVSDNDTCMAHAEEVKHGVEVSISPSYESAPAGTTLSYTVKIINKGNVPDNYALTVSDTENWGLALPENRFENVMPGHDRTATLNVTIPETAVPCTEDNIKVTATSLTDNVENSASTIAHAIIREVKITISPSWQRGGPNENIWGEYDIKYTVTVTNRSAQPDNYALTVHDNLGWDMKLLGSLLLRVPAGKTMSTTLYVKVPAEAKPGTEDPIVVTATSLTDRRVSNYASCVAQSGVIKFEMSVSPSLLRGVYDYELKYLVRITNTGTLPDTYILENYDIAGWDLRLPKPTRTVLPGADDNWSLYVRVPSDAKPGTEDKITVVATSQTDNTISDNVSCTARAALVDMKVTISPSYQRGSPGETIVYLLTVKNTGDEDEPTIYSLYADAGWELTIGDNQLIIPSGKSATTEVRVKVPDNSTHRTMDNLTVQVSAASQVVQRVVKKVSSIAQAETLKLFISPSVDSAGAGENLTFTVLVKNVGIENDNYNLTPSDDAGWGDNITLSENFLKDVTPGEGRRATLTITIPEDAEPGTEDNIMVTVIPASAPAASESENCVAIRAPPMGVKISISPKSRIAQGGATVTYAVIVKNFGTENDSYDLTVSDTEDWGDNIMLLEKLLDIPGLEHRGTILEVTIPREAEAGTIDNMLITVTSQTDNTVSASVSCSAQIEIPVWVKKAIVRADETGYNIDAADPPPEEGGTDPPPEVWYTRGDYPPLIVAKEVGKGAVVAAGLSSTCRNGRWNYEPAINAGMAKFDVLLDKAFQWMKPGAINVLWYEGYDVYNDTTRSSELVAALKALGYAVEGKSTIPITADLLSPYDILIVPQFELPPQSFSDGGDPSLLPDNDVEAIKDFVEAGGGLLVMEGNDTFGYNYYKVQNKILRGLGIYDISFQSDSVEENGLFGFYAEVTDVDFGADYREATGKTRVYVYSTTSLVVKPEKKELDVSISISPSYLEDLPGETLTYTLTITNTGRLGDAYSLYVADNAGFASSISTPMTTLAAEASENVTLSVTIPEGTPRGTESRVAVSVNSLGDPMLGDVAYGKAWTGTLGANVSISPDNRSGGRGDSLRFTVFVTNTGDFEDNYTLTVSDSLGWDPTISPVNLTIAKGKMDWAMLSVIIPQDAASGGHNNITVTATSQTDNRVSAENSCIVLVTPVGKGVDVLISPTTKSGAPGKELNFDVTVKNTGTGTDTFSLTASDTEGWGPTLSITSIPSLAGGASRTGIQLSVTIPDDAAEGDSTTITVTASGTGYDDSASCTAHAVIRGVEVSISPESRTGSLWEDVTFTVTVTNTSEAEDSYDLTVSDDAGWGAVLSDDLLTVPAGEDRTTTVSVTVPSDATEGDSTIITVTATSRDDPAVSDTATCTAKAREKAPLPIVPIGVGGAAIGGAIAVTLLVKKGMISVPFLRSRRRSMFSRMDWGQSRPSKRGLLNPRPVRSNPARARKYSKRWF